MAVTSVAARGVLACFVIAVVILVHSFFPTANASASAQEIHIGGRWKEYRASLGLPPLADTILVDVHAIARPAESERAINSRIDLRRRRKRGDEEGTKLHLAKDAMRNPTVSLREITRAFRAVALAEKAERGERENLMDEGRRKRKGRGRV